MFRVWLFDATVLLCSVYLPNLHNFFCSEGPGAPLFSPNFSTLHTTWICVLTSSEVVTEMGYECAEHNWWRSRILKFNLNILQAVLILYSYFSYLDIVLHYVGLSPLTTLHACSSFMSVSFSAHTLSHTNAITKVSASGGVEKRSNFPPDSFLFLIFQFYLPVTLQPPSTFVISQRCRTTSSPGSVKTESCLKCIAE